jgi:hypothetical protein
VRVFFIQVSPVSGLMRPLGIDRLYAWFRPNLEEFGRSVFCAIDCCARTSNAFASHAEAPFIGPSNFSQFS